MVISKGSNQEVGANTNNTIKNTFECKSKGVWGNGFSTFPR